MAERQGLGAKSKCGPLLRSLLDIIKETQSAVECVSLSCLMDKTIIKLPTGNCKNTVCFLSNTESALVVMHV